MRWIIVSLTLVVVSNASAQYSPQQGSIDVPLGYELEVELEVSPLLRRHRLARRAGIAVIPTLVLGALGVLGLRYCDWGGDYPGTCSLPLALIGAGAGATLVTGGVFVYATNKLARELRAAGASISRARGIVAAIFYGLPYLQPFGLILAARQARLNRIALRRIEDVSPRYY